MCRCGTLQSAECHFRTLVAECHPGTSDSLRNFTPVEGRVSPQDFLLVLGASRPKITNLYFWPSCDQNLGSVFLWCDYGSNFRKFRPGEISGLHANGPESFPSGIFTYFGRPTTKNYDLVFLTVVRPNGAFDQRATKTRIRSFWPSCDYFPISVLLIDGATNGGLRNIFGRWTIESFWKDERNSGDIIMKFTKVRKTGIIFIPPYLYYYLNSKMCSKSRKKIASVPAVIGQ